jgi:hypothetical protein
MGRGEGGVMREKPSVSQRKRRQIAGSEIVEIEIDAPIVFMTG